MDARQMQDFMLEKSLENSRTWHFMECDAYSELGKVINLESVMQKRSGYLRSVMAKRKELEAKLQKTTN